jgi:hypothetical protein
VIFTGPRHDLPGVFFWEERKMWKIVVGFIVIAGLALFLLNKGGDIDLSGEKHGASRLAAPVVAAVLEAAVRS